MNSNKRIKNFDDMFSALEDIHINIISGKNGVHSKRSLGSTSPDLVKKVIKAEAKWLKTAYSNLK